ncbi:hypothetical protein BLNAU_17669 [Blattamonas nauphoetae]|uniref:Uncharacterized protein n=1 Tax=Blattamonas nauphoetae TaxID=2049346 RepID=A0ABQ9X6L3_9EUKA|nr:hypothetical protein BLNAU_17669 [Blattamonas nauphoetae]
MIFIFLINSFSALIPKSAPCFVPLSDPLTVIDALCPSNQLPIFTPITLRNSKSVGSYLNATYTVADSSSFLFDCSNSTLLASELTIDSVMNSLRLVLAEDSDITLSEVTIVISRVLEPLFVVTSTDLVLNWLSINIVDHQIVAHSLIYLPDSTNGTRITFSNSPMVGWDHYGRGSVLCGLCDSIVLSTIKSDNISVKASILPSNDYCALLSPLTTHNDVLSSTCSISGSLFSKCVDGISGNIFGSRNCSIPASIRNTTLSDSPCSFRSCSSTTDTSITFTSCSALTSSSATTGLFSGTNASLSFVDCSLASDASTACITIAGALSTLKMSSSALSSKTNGLFVSSANLVQIDGETTLSSAAGSMLWISGPVSSAIVDEMKIVENVRSGVDCFLVMDTVPSSLLVSSSLFETDTTRRCLVELKKCLGGERMSFVDCWFVSTANTFTPNLILGATPLSCSVSLTFSDTTFVSFPNSKKGFGMILHDSWLTWVNKSTFKTTTTLRKKRKIVFVSRHENTTRSWLPRSSGQPSPSADFPFADLLPTIPKFKMDPTNWIWGGVLILFYTLGAIILTVRVGSVCSELEPMEPVPLIRTLISAGFTILSLPLSWVLVFYPKFWRWLVFQFRNLTSTNILKQTSEGGEVNTNLIWKYLDKSNKQTHAQRTKNHTALKKWEERNALVLMMGAAKQIYAIPREVKDASMKTLGEWE